MITLILAGDYREAQEIATLAGLKGSIGWQIVDTQGAVLRGRRDPIVLTTGRHCWAQGMTWEQALVISNRLLVVDARVIYVPCPAEWKASGFTLPRNWRGEVPEPMRIHWLKILRRLFSR